MRSPPAARTQAAGVLLAACALLLPASAASQAFSGSLLDAVRLGLRQSATIAGSRQQVVQGEGVLLSAQAPFDTQWSAGLRQQRSYLPAAAGGSALTHQFGWQAGASRRLASGMVLNPTLSVDRIRDDGFNSNGPSSGTLALNVLLPLRKGSSSDVNLAPVASAGEALQAAQSGYRHSLGQSIARTATAYWELVAAGRTLDLARLAEARSRKLLADARKLAGADEIPRADLLKYEARRAMQEGSRLVAEQQLFEAAQGLAQAMNVPLASVEAAGAVDTFPQPQEAGLALLQDTAAFDQLVAGSVDRRQDVRAARQRVAAARTLAEAAQRDSGTQLDVGFGVGYAGLGPEKSALGTLRTLGRPAPGPNVSLTLNYVLPAGDFERRGLLLQRQAAAEQAAIEHEALRTQVDGEVRAQLTALRSAAARLERAEHQRQLQTTIFYNEQRSYQAGLSTLLDLFTTESQLTEVQAAWIQAQRDFAQALVLFRYQTASLPQSDADLATLDAATLTTLPDPRATPLR